MKKLFGFLSVLTVLLFSACSGGSVLTPKSTGMAYEILVVMDSLLWKSPAGEALFEVLDSDIPGLPQSEATFRVSYVDPGYFDNILRPVRNIVIAKIDPTQYTMAKMSSQKDVWAAPQAVLYINAPTKEEFEMYVTNNYRDIIDYFTEEEMNRRVDFYQTSYSPEVSEKVLSMFGVEIKTPKDINKMKEGKDFLWASNHAYQSMENLVIYSYPYTDSQTFTLEYQLAKRDSFMKANIPGGPEGSYMTTQYALPPVYRAKTINGQYCAEIRGLWEIKGDMMGGPFVSYVRLDEAHQRVICTEVFVYAPEKNKRMILRSLEAALYGVKIRPSETTEPKDSTQLQ